MTVVCNSCDPMDYSPPGSSVHGISFPGKNTAYGLPLPFQRTFPTPGSNSGGITGGFFTYWTTRGASEVGKYLQMLEVLVAQLCPTLCNPMDCSLPASSAHGVFQARILEWVAAIPFSRGSSQPRDQTRVSGIAGRYFTTWTTREARDHLL